MIAYEDLVVALTNWRIHQGLPTSAVTFLSPDTGGVDLALPVSDPLVSAQADGGMGEAIAVEDDAFAVEDEAIAVEDEAIVVEDEAIAVEDEAIVVEDDAIAVDDYNTGEIEEIAVADEYAVDSETEMHELAADAGAEELADASFGFEDETQFAGTPVPGESPEKVALDATGGALPADDMLIAEEVAEPQQAEEVAVLEESFADLGAEESFAGLDNESTVMNQGVQELEEPAPIAVEMDAADPDEL